MASPCPPLNPKKGGFSVTDDAGQSLIIVVLGLFVLLGMVAVVLDGSNVYSQRRQMQVAADAAAIAGARKVALGATTAEVELEIQRFAQNNGADAWEWTYIRNGEGVRVTTTSTFPTFFAQLFRINAATASAIAEATLSGIRRTDNLIPIGVRQFDFQTGQSYTLMDVQSLNAPGSFGWLSWTGSTSNVVLADNLCNPSNSGFWNTLDWVPTGPGWNVSAAVRNCMDQWVGKEVTIIIYDEVVGQGSNTMYRIHSFAQFKIEGYDFNPSPKEIRGQFVRWVKPGVGGGPNRGLVTVQMTR